MRSVAGNSVNIPSGQTRTATASCDPDEVVTGGGIRAVDGINTVNPTHVFQGIHGSPNTFELTYTNIGGGEATVQVFAECAKLYPDGIVCTSRFPFMYIAVLLLIERQSITLMPGVRFG